MMKEGDYVIAKTDTVLRLTQLHKERPLFLGKRKILISGAIGHPYGSFFEIQGNGKLSLKENYVPAQLSTAVSTLTLKDNRSLNNTNDSQKLTTSDIEAFKHEGVPGEEIVKIIVQNSSSFDDKTSYSQEKYLRKKQLKYVNVLQVLQPNIRLLAETYFCYSPQKICNLRMDSLSQMLSFCNVMSGGEYIVIDSVLGLLSGAVLEKIGEQGCVLQLMTHPSPVGTYGQAVSALNFSKERLASVFISVDFQKVMDCLVVDSNKETSTNPSTEEVKDANPGDEAKDANPGDEAKDANPGDEAIDTPSSEKHRVKQLLLEKAKSLLVQKNMDGMLVACKHHPAFAIDLLDYLAFSRPFAIFSMYQEPLVDCYSELKSRGDVIMLNISETWLRKYQILPERTHPEYSMSGSSGFLLTGIKVENKP